MTYVVEVMAWLKGKQGPYVNKMELEAPDVSTLLRMVKYVYNSQGLDKWKLVDWRRKM